MKTDKQLSDKLTVFRNRDKFSASAWNERGLNPSASELCMRIDTLLNDCSDCLIKAANQNATPKEFKQILKTGISTLNRTDYDTEEKEFICDYLFELSNIVQVDIKYNLNSWLYGKALGTLIKATSLLRQPDKVIETLSQDCTGCGAKLETYILRKQEGIKASDWIVIQCNNCSEYNLFESQPNVKETKSGNYKCVEFLRKFEYTKESAKARLEQIKLFRKK
jgi:hypothetical protein